MLKINNLKISYDQEDIIKGINLEIEAGEILAVVGESGAGKTSLALSIMGLCTGKVSGEILYGGNNLLCLSEVDKRNLLWNEISMVFQDINRSLNPVMTILMQLMEPLLEHKVCNFPGAKERALQMLTEVGLSEEIGKAYPHQLSGGEIQRVLIAMALTNNPGLVILDEPTACLDVISKVEILEILKRTLTNKTAVLVTHDLSTALKLADRIAVLYSGRIVEIGMADRIISIPRHPYTRGLLRSYPNMSTTKDLQGIPGKKGPVAQGCNFADRCTQKVPACTTTLPELKLVEDNRHVACLRGGIVSIIRARKLVKNYGRVHALKGVTIEIDAGETLAIVGESGSGKTTLAKCLVGLEKPDSGEIIFQGEKIEKRDKEFFKNVQMIFQNPQDCMSHRMNVLEAVMEPLIIQSIAGKEERIVRAKRALKDVELPVEETFLQKYAHHLSSGELQRIAIARSLILEPKLLIADEPTSALDASVQAKIVKLLLNLQEQKGLTMIFITHDIALARKICDKVVVMLSGSVIEAGPASQVFTQPLHPYTRDLINSAPNFSMQLGDANIPLKKVRGACQYYSRCNIAGTICLTEEPDSYVQKNKMVRCHRYGTNSPEMYNIL